MYKEEIGFGERVVAGLSYITAGLVGFIWLIIAFLTKKNFKPFLHYHVFQSIFLSIFYYIISTLLGLILQILSVIPIVNQIVSRIFFFFNMPLFFGFSIISTLIYLVIFYLVFTSLQGRYSYIPWVSDIIKENLRR